MVSQRGIEANPVKVDAIRNMVKPANKEDVMKLTSMMVTLNRFISKLNEKGLPFFELLKKADKFEWDVNSQVVKWSAELSEFDLDFCPRQGIKSQILADFMAEWIEILKPSSLERPEHWTMYFDGALNLEGASTGVLFICPKGEQLRYILQIHYKATNNGTEYEALIHDLRIDVSLGIKHILAYGDSKVVIEQVNKNWDCIKETMDAYYGEIQKLDAYFDGLEFHHVPREHNVIADILSKLGSKHAQVPVGVFIQDLWKPSIKILDPDQVNNSAEAPLDLAPTDFMMIEA
ncbi:uncharacterized protein [Setaria viridis]|uniref:uncharacterized protein n=1 Tax=Setaria viridis TaxID=4556 RepID=UPI003B3BE4C6